MRRFLLGLLAISLASISAHAQLAVTPTPPVCCGTNKMETGENSASAAQILTASRFKPSMATATISVSAAAGAATLNSAAGIITATTATAGASGTAPTVLTITNGKVQTTDQILCSVDNNGITSGAVITCSPHITAAGTFTLTLLDGSSTAMTSSTIVVFYQIFPSGNPN